MSMEKLFWISDILATTGAKMSSLWEEDLLQYWLIMLSQICLHQKKNELVSIMYTEG